MAELLDFTYYIIAFLYFNPLALRAKPLYSGAFSHFLREHGRRLAEHKHGGKRDRGYVAEPFGLPTLTAPFPTSEGHEPIWLFRLS